MVLRPARGSGQGFNAFAAGAGIGYQEAGICRNAA